MSAQPLQSLLLEADQAGSFYLTASDLEPLLAAADELGFCCVTIDLAGCLDKTELMQRFADGFDFPDHFGHNWDALADCLGDLQWLPGEGYVLAVEHPQELRLAAAGDYATLVSLLEDASLDWRERGVPFWAFIALPDSEFDAMPA